MQVRRKIPPGLVRARAREESLSPRGKKLRKALNAIAWVTMLSILGAFGVGIACAFVWGYQVWTTDANIVVTARGCEVKDLRIGTHSNSFREYAWLHVNSGRHVVTGALNGRPFRQSVEVRPGENYWSIDCEERLIMAE